MGTLNDTLEAFFRARPHVLIDGRELASIAGFYGWRSRVSNLRRDRGMDIQNVPETRRNAAGKPYKVSRYRYVPAVEHHADPVPQGHNLNDVQPGRLL